MCRGLLLSLALSSLPLAAGAEDVAVQNALGFIRRQQNEDGSFGKVQPHLQTGFAALALLCAAAPPSETDRAIVERAVAYLEKTGASDGDLGDRVYATESHAVATLAAVCALPYVREDALRKALAEKSGRAVRLLFRLQDPSSSSRSRGGWRTEGFKGQDNDRRSSAWALLASEAARQVGMPVKDANLDRGVRYMLGSFKDATATPPQVGGFSVDAEGLAVEQISAMGGWVLVRFRQPEDMIDLNRRWLVKNPPLWAGPNYFYSSFFRVRTLKFSDRAGRDYQRTLQRLRTQIQDHQAGDGSVGIPPGEAQNSADMGPVFTSALSVLILNVDDSRLCFDEDYRVRPLF